MNSTTASAVRQISLLDSIGGEPWYKVPLSAVREAGSASLILSSLYSVTSNGNRTTFRAVEKIADGVGVKVDAARNHLRKLTFYGYIKNGGRSSSKNGHSRRTCDWTLTKKGVDAFSGFYGILPWWMTRGDRNGKRFKWSEQLLASMVLAKMASLKSVVIQASGDVDDTELAAGIEELGENRFRFTLSTIERMTAMDSKTIIAAKKSLRARKMIYVYQENTDGNGRAPHLIEPNHEYRCRITSVGNDRCYLEF